MDEQMSETEPQTRPKGMTTQCATHDGRTVAVNLIHIVCTAAEAMSAIQSLANGLEFLHREGVTPTTAALLWDAMHSRECCWYSTEADNFLGRVLMDAEDSPEVAALGEHYGYFNTWRVQKPRAVRPRATRREARST